MTCRRRLLAMATPASEWPQLCPSPFCCQHLGSGCWHPTVCSYRRSFPRAFAFHQWEVPRGGEGRSGGQEEGRSPSVSPPLLRQFLQQFQSSNLLAASFPFASRQEWQRLPEMETHQLASLSFIWLLSLLPLRSPITCAMKGVHESPCVFLESSAFWFGWWLMQLNTRGKKEWEWKQSKLGRSTSLSLSCLRWGAGGRWETLDQSEVLATLTGLKIGEFVGISWLLIAGKFAQSLWL